MWNIKIITIIIFLSSLLINAQSYPGDPSEYTKLTNEPADKQKTYIEVYDYSDPNNPKIYIYSYEKFAELLGVSGDQSIDGTYSFLNAIQLAELASTTTNNGIFINTSTGQIAQYKNGAIINYATTNDLVQHGLVDSNHVVYDNANDTLFATYLVTGIFDIRNGVWYMPYSSSLLSDSLSGNMRFYFSDQDSLLHLNAKNSDNDKYRVDFVTKAWIDKQGFGSANLSYWLANGDQSGLQGEKKISTGKIRYTSSATGFSSSNARSGIVSVTSLPNITDADVYVGDVFSLGGQNDTDGSGLQLNSLYVVGLDQDYNKFWIKFIDEEKVKRLDAKILSSNAPTTFSQSTDTLDFSNKNYIAGIYGAQGAQTIDVINYSSGWVSFTIYSQDAVTINIPGVTIDWVGDPNENNPNFGVGEYVEVVLKYITSTVAKGSYSW